MSWTTITADAVQSRITDAELVAARTAAIKAGQADPLAEAISRVTQEVRGRVAANASNTLGDGDTIPSECEDAAIAVIIFRLYSRLPITMPQERKDAKDDALAFLRDVADGKVAIVAPATASPQQVTSIAPSISARRRHFTRDQQDGI